jgi:hypothetical protein
MQQDTKEQDKADVAALFYALLGPLNPPPAGSYREFHYSEQELQAVCHSAAAVWMKYLPSGPAKYAEETTLAMVLIGTAGGKFARYKSRRMSEGNPLQWPGLIWRKIKALFTRRKGKVTSE